MRSFSPASRILSFALLSLFVHAAHAQPDALNFFNNWFVTGDYAVAGTGLLNTNGKGSITMKTVPCTSGIGSSAAIVPCSTAGSVPAYPIAAFLYWQTVESTSTAAAAKGSFNGNPIVGTVLGSDSSTACWLSTKQAPSQTLRVYRADVLRFLPIDPATQLRIGNTTHTVALGNGETGNVGVLATEGASLVVIYRVVVPGKPLIAPLRSVVIYDGEFTLSTNKQSMTQNIAGFYQSAGNPGPTMTHIVGNGQTGPGSAQFRGNLTVNGATPAGISDHPFAGAQGANWDNLTFGFNLPPNASSVQVAMNKTDNAPSCLSWGAMVTSTNVQDSDNDGLLDIWESKGLHRNTQVSPATFGGCSDYPADPCVDLPAMGAKNGVQDIFLQLDWMHGYGDDTGGINGTGYHSHMPPLTVLTNVAQAFASHNIALHFDVGNNYQGLGSYIIPYKNSTEILAQGGSDIDEATLVCVNSSTHTCDYQEPYPVLSFKLGLASVRDGNHFLNIPAHFAQNRKDIFHYVLFAHALGGPYNSAGQATTTNPLSVSGIGDRPGGDLMITLGLWRSVIPASDQVGSMQVQSGTLMHELGHNLDLSHAGLLSTPNCKPNYPSVMSYMYQTRGLTDASGAEHIDFSNGLLAPLNENSLSATASLGPVPYRIRFFGPLNSNPNSPLFNSPGQAAQVHCDGTAITNGAQEIRFEGSTLSTPDWSNGTVTPLGTPFALDVNFNGILSENLTDQPDWTSLNLQQIGGRPLFGSLSSGSVSTDAGSVSTDAGALAADAGSVSTDAGSVSTDAGSVSTDAGSVSTDAGSVSTDAGDEDYDTHIKSATDGIPTPQQCTGCGLTATNGLSGITLAWTPPATGGNLTYNIYRCPVAGCVPTTRILTGVQPSSPTTPTFTDSVNDFVDSGATCPATKTCYNTTYTYSVTAVSTAGVESPYSNTAASEVTHLFVVADVQNAVYGAAIPTPTFKVYGDVAGSLSTSAISCAYTPAIPRNAGPYTIACAGPATTSATDGVTYNAPYLSYTPGGLTITPRPITVTAAASSKTYDGTRTSTATPTITSGTLAYSDTVTWTETYDNRNAGTNHVMTPAGTVSDGNSGNNYAVTFATINTGVILQAPLTITAVANTKTYDGNISAAAPPTVSGVQTGDSVTGLAETYDTANAGTGKTLSVSAYMVNDGNGGLNYTVTKLPNTAGVINKANAVVTVIPYSVTYDGNPHTATGTATGVLNENLSGLVLTGTTHINAGTYAPDPWTFTDVTGNYNNAGGAVTDTIAQAPATVTLSNLSQTYTGTALSPNVTTNPTGLAYSLTGAPDTAPGSYNVTAMVTNPNYAGSASGTFVIVNPAVNLATLVLNGNAMLNGTTLRLTNNVDGEASSAWLTSQRPLGSGFSTSFQFQITPGSGQTLADGFAFVIQSAPAGTAALGTTGAGEYLGYAGIPNSIAIEFDTYQNTNYGDPAGPHIGIQSNGIAANSPAHNTSANLAGPVQATFADGNVHTATITYDGTTLSVFLDGSNTPVVSAAVNLGSLLGLTGGNAYAGFTAATGADSENSDILSWNWN
jgi:hypothetical protein